MTGAPSFYWKAWTSFNKKIFKDENKWSIPISYAAVKWVNEANVNVERRRKNWKNPTLLKA